MKKGWQIPFLGYKVQCPDRAMQVSCLSVPLFSLFPPQQGTVICSFEITEREREPLFDGRGQFVFRDWNKVHHKIKNRLSGYPVRIYDQSGILSGPVTVKIK